MEQVSESKLLGTASALHERQFRSNGILRQSGVHSFAQQIIVGPAQAGEAVQRLIQSGLTRSCFVIDGNGDE